jgi:hypothetical protein
MEIDMEKVLGVLEVQRRRDDTKRGMQPEMILSCLYGHLYGQNQSDTAFCEKCRSYEICYPTLKIVAIERKPFERS